MTAVSADALTARVKEEARRLGARLVGVGSVDRWVNAPVGHRPQDFLPAARAVVSFGLPLFPAMTDWPRFMAGTTMYTEEEGGELPNRHEAAWQVYARMQYDAINLELMAISYRLGCALLDLGYQVVTPPPTGGSGWANARLGRFHQFSQRHAAVACGLGELGLNNMFISPEYGIRVRLGSVITDAPLAPDPLNRIGAICDDCEACIQACPDPRTFGERYDYELLPGYRLTSCVFNKEYCPGNKCGACLAVCPIGR